jgi:hypothetical protein
VAAYAAELRESYTEAGVVLLGLKVDKAYAAYVDCREANGRPCEGGAAPASESAPASTSTRRLAPATLPDAARVRFDLAIRNTLDEQNAARWTAPCLAPEPGSRCDRWTRVSSSEDVSTTTPRWGT